jgi:hypothetical protein
MALKRRRDAITKEIPKTYTFGRSLIDDGDITGLYKNRMVGTARDPRRDTMPKPRENEVVIFRDLLFAGLRFPLHPAVVDILRYRHISAPTHPQCNSAFCGVYVDMSHHKDQTFRRRICLPPMQFCVLRCICGYVAPQRSNLPPKDLLRRTRFITKGARSSKRRGTAPWRRIANSAV